MELESMRRRVEKPSMNEEPKNKQEKQVRETQNRSDLVENEELAVAFACHVLQRFVGVENVQIETLHELVDRNPES